MTSRNPGNFGNVSNYEAYVGAWSKRIASEFIGWMEPEADGDWLDVGCGTGVVSEAIVADANPRSLAGIDPAAPFIETARQRMPDFADGFLVGDAMRLPFADHSRDFTVSGLVLNFLPDRKAALQEMHRVTRPGGTVGLYLWDYREGMEPFARLWEAIIAVEPATRESEPYRKLAGMSLESLEYLYAEAGLTGIETAVLNVPIQIESFAHYWNWIEGGQGSAPSFAMALDPASQKAVRQGLRTLVRENEDGHLDLNARALAIRGWPEQSKSDLRLRLPSFRVVRSSPQTLSGAPTRSWR